MAAVTEVPGGWTIYARDGNYLRKGQISQFTSLDAVLRFDDVDTWSLVVPADDPIVPLLAAPKAGIEVRWVGSPTAVLSGPVVNTDHSWVPDNDQVTFSGNSDDVWLFRRLAHQDPANADSPDGAGKWTAAYDSRTGAAETILKQFVNVNLGPGAIAARRMPGLTIPTTAGLGSTLTEQGRMQPLIALCQAIAKATAAPGLGFSITADPSGAVLNVYAPSDHSADVVLAPDLGNIASYDQRLAVPNATVVYGGGSGAGNARIFSIAKDAGLTATYGRIETFDDSQDATLTLLAQRAATALAANAPLAEVKVSPLAGIDSSGFLSQWVLGDTITVITDQVLVDVIRQVHLTLDKDGVKIDLDQSGISAQDGGVRVPTWQAVQRKLLKTVRDLARR